ncbi:MAG TPA: hypothetical protein GXZ47_01420 [Treponema sp.]|nr:hypothetical protein [Treponema sp.]
MMRPLSCIIFLSLLVGCATVKTPDRKEPTPYEKDEFSNWQKDLRRAEIIAFGALPFVTFMSSVYFDIYRYIDHDQNDAYLPWPMKNKETAVPLTEDEQKKVLLTAVGISVGVAVFDFGFRAIRRHIRNSKQDKKNREARKVIIIEGIDFNTSEMDGN